SPRTLSVISRGRVTGAGSMTCSRVVGISYASASSTASSTARRLDELPSTATSMCRSEGIPVGLAKPMPRQRIPSARTEPLRHSFRVRDVSAEKIDVSHLGKKQAFLTVHVDTVEDRAPAAQDRLRDETTTERGDPYGPIRSSAQHHEIRSALV